MKRLRAFALGALLVAPAPQAPLPLLLAPTAGAVAMLAAPGDAEARSSGGYSRPRSSVRTPSFRPSRPYSAPRTPSTSGGYSRPSGGGWGSIFGGSSRSSGDRSISREQSGSALDAYRSRERAQQPPMRVPDVRPAPGRSAGGYDAPLRIPRRAPSSYGGGYYGGPGYAGSGRGLGSSIRDIALMWLVFQSLNRPGYADYFHHHQNDPAYQRWRAEAESRAASDPEVREKLSQLDAQLQARQGQPVDPGFVPPDLPAPSELDRQADRRTPTTRPFDADASGGSGGILVPLLLLLVVGGVAFMIFRRKTQSASRAGRRMPQPGTPLGTATEILRGKLSGDTYQPKLFRVGMTLPVDPTPFILASGTKVTNPGIGSGGTLTVMAVGELDGPGGGDLMRAYIGDQGFFQMHLDANGVPDECRYFSRLDEIHPADADEWAFWLAPSDGMIGWTEFETKDGKIYARAWSPGGSRIEPRVFTETLTDVNGTRTVRKSMMLYQGPSGAAAPAPEVEYILVTAVEAGSQAWIEVCAGIDVNPAALSLT